jgi:endonuclease YncB( thermonuclease family)
VKQKISQSILLLLAIGLLFYLPNLKTTNNQQKESIREIDLSKTPSYGEYQVVRKVIDGDTIELDDGERLRYIGVDTPEVNDPRKPVQCFAKEASAMNRDLVEGKKVKFFKDITDRDRYGRLLGYVYLEDGTFVNLKLVKDGYAFSYPYPPDVAKQEEFNAAQKFARTNRLGLWAGCDTTQSSSGRYQTQAVE